MTTLAVRGLHVRYGERTVLDDVSFEVGPGEILGFVGANGAGKTTTMRAVLGMVVPDAGDVLVDGAPIDAARRRRIGYMPEERGLYPRMRVGDQLAHLARLHGLDRTAARAAALRWTTRLGVADRLGDPVERLSLGNQQRVQLAAALVHDPDLLVLDEPFSGLDPVAVGVMAAVLREAAARSVPVLFSSHQLDLVQRLCDRVGIIAGGRTVAVGTVDELRADAPVRYRLVSSPLPDGWGRDLPGVVDVVRCPLGIELELADDAPETAATVLRAGVAAATVTEFTRIRPDLTDLYREVIGA